MKDLKIRSNQNPEIEEEHEFSSGFGGLRDDHL
jgi:hypothetical protein